MGWPDCNIAIVVAGGAGVVGSVSRGFVVAGAGLGGRSGDVRMGSCIID